MKQPKAEDIVEAWRRRYQRLWSERGVGASSRMYVYVVAENRLKHRSGLDFGYSVAYPGAIENQARRELRKQVDQVLREWR